MICITGDLHGDFGRLCAPELKKLKSRDVFIICGDFGFVWDGSKEEQKILKKIGKRRYDTLFVEGCHDNYDLLKEYPVVAYKGGKARKISGNLYQLMRGEIYEIDGKSVFAFGGGDSKDSALDLSDETKAFWEEEQPSVQETQHALDQLAAHRNRVDLIVTHDAPGAIKRFLYMDDNELSFIHSLFDEVVSRCTFTHWYFGRYHLDKLIPPRYTAVYKQIIKVE